MQMPDDEPTPKRPKIQNPDETTALTEVDFSALNDLPDSLLSMPTSLDAGNLNGLSSLNSNVANSSNEPMIVSTTVNTNSSISQQINGGQLSSQQIVNRQHPVSQPIIRVGGSSTGGYHLASNSPVATSSVFNVQQSQLPQTARPASLAANNNVHLMSTVPSRPSQTVTAVQLNGMHQRPQAQGQPLISTVRPQQQQQQRPQQLQRQQQVTMRPNLLSPAAGSGSGGVALSADPTKQRMITQQLVLLLHAHKCQRANQPGPNEDGSNVCTLQYCAVMKKALAHMSTCQLGRLCKENHCVSSRQIIAHWKNCSNPTCAVCLPLKSVHKRGSTIAGSKRPLQNGDGSTQYTANSSVANPMNTMGVNGVYVTGRQSAPANNTHPQYQPNYPNISHPSQTVSRQLSLVQQQQQQQLPSHGQVLQNQLTSPVANHISPNINISSHQHINSRQPQVLASPHDSNFQGNSSPNNFQIQRQQNGVAINVEEMKKAYAALGMEYSPNNNPPTAGVNLPLRAADAGNSQVVLPKPWHHDFSTDLRTVLVRKLVQAIFPTPDLRVISDPRMVNLLNYAKKVENDMYTISNSRDEYYQRLAEKIYKIRIELEEKRKQRQRQELQDKATKALLDPKNDPMMVNTGQTANAMAEPKAEAVDIKLDIKTEIKTEPKPFVAAGLAHTSSQSPRTDGSQTFPATKNLLQKAKQEPTTPDAKSSADTLSPSTSAPPVPSLHKKVVPTKVWQAEELKSAILPLLRKLLTLEEALAFKQPVDPVKLNIPDYFDIIKNPMDLSTVQKKLETGKYKDPWEFTNDMWLICDNAWLYNKKTSKVYKSCSKLAEAFESELDALMKKFGFCCGKKYVFYPNVLVCYGKQTCTIAQYQVYYAYDNRYTYCDKCFAEITTETVELTNELTGSPLTLKKEDFVQTKNDVLDPEPITHCKDCERQFHSVCVQHMDTIWEMGYLCDACLKTRNQKRKENKYAAKRLPTCKLSTHIEDRVNSYLHKKGIISAGEVIIRILSFTEKETEVKPGMKAKFPEMAAMIPYRSKALFAFQSCPERPQDVCFFSMHVQEYDSNAPAPNTSRVYISYLDSVHFFTPREYRTAIYHEILIGYFDYVRVLGFNWGHIWACPPSEGDDYIFHAHPAEQKVPKPKRLQEWYKKMLDKAIIEGVVSDYKDIYKDAVEKNMSSASELPYFEGDFWTTILEDCVKECQEEEAKRQEEEADTDEVDDVMADDGQVTSESALGAQGAADNPTSIATLAQINKMKKVKGNKTKHLKKNSSKKQITCSDLSTKLFSNIEKHKDMFFVIRLKNRLCTAPDAPRNTSDPDNIMSSELMDARDSFLTMCRERHWEFSSLRRATYSTMAFLCEVHTSNRDGGFVYTCNACKAQVETRYHCVQCEDFDLCVPCYGTKGHEHKMEKLGLGLTESSSDQGDSQLPPAENRKRSLQRCIDSLVHASMCRDANCKLTVCEKMKRVVSHTKACKRKTTGGCPICKQLITLCCYHAKICRESMCPVPFCTNIKNKFKHQQQLQRLQQTRLLHRRVADMNRSAGGSASSSVAARGGVMARQLTVNTSRPAVLPAATSGSLQRNSSATQSHSLITQSPVGYNPQQRMVQQQQPIMNSLLQTPITQPQSQSQQLQQQLQLHQQMKNSVMPQPIVLNQGSQNVQVVRPLQHTQQQVMRVSNQHQHQSGQSAAPNPNLTAEQAKQQQAKQKLHRLLSSLSSGRPQTPEEKQQLCILIKNNPSILATIQRQRNLFKQQQQMQQQQQQGGVVRRGQQILPSGTQSTSGVNSFLSTNQQQSQMGLPQNNPQVPLAGLSGTQANINMGLIEETPSSVTDELSRYADSL